MKKSFYFVLGLASILTACQDSDLTNSEKVCATKTQEVVDLDPTQNFNLATRASIFVLPGSSQEIKVYMKAGNSWNKVADYQDVVEGREICFDVVKGTKEVFVTDGIQAFNVELGSAVSFGGTRAGTIDLENVISLNEGSKYPYQYYDESLWNEMLEKLPEGKRNRDITIHNFTMMSTGPFVVYPFYWNCQALDYIGIYWRDANGNLVEHNLFGNHTDNESVQMWDEEAACWNSDLMKGEWNLMYDAAWSAEPYAIKKSGFAMEGANQFRSKGIVVDLPVGTVFGFYIDPRYYGCYLPYNYTYLQSNYPNLLPADFGEYKHYYSDANLNPLDCIATPDGEYGDSLKYCFATYVDKNGHVVVAGDDAVGGYKTAKGYRPTRDNLIRCFDFNDIAFNIFGEEPLVLSNEPQEWLLPFEDFTENEDLDFNDIVVKLSYASGSSKAAVTPMAAGGNVASMLVFNDTEDASKAQVLGEIHSLLGAQDQNYQPINTKKRGTAGETIEISVNDPAHFSIANAQSAAAGIETQKVVGLYVETEGKSAVSKVYDGATDAPAMLVIPSLYDKDHRYYEWAWPTENTSIAVAYGVTGHSFAEWVAGSASAADWYMYPSGQTVDEKSILYADLFDAPLTAEYVMSKYGTTMNLPAKNADGNYDFVRMNKLTKGNKGLVITVVLKGVNLNQMVVAGKPVGIWSKMGLNGNLTTVGQNAGISGPSYEGVFQINLSQNEVKLLNQSNWSITCGNDSEILYMSYKQ